MSVAYEATEMPLEVAPDCTGLRGMGRIRQASNPRLVSAANHLPQRRPATWSLSYPTSSPRPVLIIPGSAN